MKPAAHIQSAIELLSEIYNSALPADVVTHAYMRQRRYIGSGDRRQILEIVYGIMRQYWLLDGMLSHCWANPGGDPIQKARRHVLAYLVKLKAEPFVAELFSGDEYAPKPLSAAENDLIANLVSLDNKSLPEAAQLSCPGWIYDILKETYSTHYREILFSLKESATVDLRVNTLKGSREHVLAKLQKQGIEGHPTPLSPWGIRITQRQPLRQHPLLQQGVLEIQDEGSQLIALACDAQPGMAIWDYCAGAAGKTLALAAMMQNKGRIIATDVIEWRLKNAPQRLRRAGVHNVETRLLDEESGKWLKRQAGKFDCVLVDAPCTGSGTWRRNPELRWRMSEKGFQEILQKQRDILQKASSLVKPGGRLVYATCSLLKPENRDQIAEFLDRNADFKLHPLSLDFAKEGVLELNPVEHQTDGFFAAVMMKNKN
ncbi:MAG: RsmB/NOP family class I SAM-dependent RNA methyltransferase [Candidatus Paracaedibacteraceae bacterium]|nr:RsmB/NOP family class I SAM-dependent RNA methyltransferase [Candidatus Paracaedibacteraceae bacterium]